MPHGKICYLEIPAKTAEPSAEFYSCIFGWKVRQRGDSNLAFDDTGGVSGLWSLLPEKTDPLPSVPAWPDFLRGCLRYRQSPDDQLPNAPRAHAPYHGD